METKELTTQQNGVTIKVESLENFSSKLHEIPHKKDIKANKHADNALYLPIAVVETKLDELFFGLWQTKGFEYRVIANEIVGSIELGVFHPVAKTWLWRSGAGAVMIQQKSERRGGSGDITDIGQKIKNTLVKDFPHLKAQCLKNAALSFGPAFGRNLNRDYWDSFEPITEQIELSNHAKELIDRCSNEKELNDLVKSKPAWHKNDSIYNMIIEKRKSLRA